AGIACRDRSARVASRCALALGGWERDRCPDQAHQLLRSVNLALAQVPAGIGRQRYCHIGQPNTAKLIAVRIDRRDEMWISLALPWRQRCGDPVCCLPAEIEPRDPRRMRWKPHSRNRGGDGLYRLRCDGAAVDQAWISAL